MQREITRVREPDAAMDPVEIGARAAHAAFRNRNPDAYDPRAWDRLQPASQEEWRITARAVLAAVRGAR